ncbi:hypothetical protein [Aminipila terrae]|uniref:hypothetical protein n=1 Tax=Aminipila terrae TaxID=2697030 RepID=UPI0038BD1275
MKKYFKPEFLNRIDDIVVFSPLTENQITKIIDISMISLKERLQDKNIAIELTDDAKRLIADESYTPAYGARPVKRYLQKHIETEIAAMIIKGQIMDGSKILLDSDGEKLEFKVQ